MPLKQRNSAVLRTVEDVKTAEHEAVELVKTLTWAQIEEWQRDNEYIVSGYRVVQNSWKGCAHSIFGYLHNETVNIHSHLWGALLFAFLLAANHFYVVAKYPSATWVDSAMFSVFLASAVFCLTASSLYHTVLCHSEAVHERCHALDYSGIIVLIVGSFTPAIYYAFFCSPRLQVLYLTIFSLSGLGAAYIVLSPDYSKPSHRGARTKVFIALGLSSVGPVVHALLTHGPRTLRTEMGFDWIVISGALYIGGALLYANRIPERFSPGTFDYFFASHQIFHVAVVLAALSHYIAILSAIEHWHGRQTGVCPAEHVF